MAISYPSDIRDDKEKLFSLYPLFQQIYGINNEKAGIMKLDREQYTDKYRTYSRKISKPVLKELHAERNRLKEIIFRTEYPNLKAWNELREDEQDAEYLRMFGNKAELSKLSTKVAYSNIPVLQAVSLDSLPATAPKDPLVDFTSATWNNGTPQSDPDSDLTIVANKITFSSVDRNYDCYFYGDYGAGHFNDDYEHLFEFYISSIEAGALVYPWAMANAIDDFTGLDDDDVLGVRIYEHSVNGRCVLLYQYYNGGSSSDGYYGFNTSTLYYVEVERDYGAGDPDFGTLYLYLCTDDYWDDGGTQIDSLSVSIGGQVDYRYLYGTVNYNSGNPGYDISGYSQNYDIQEAPPSSDVLPYPRDMRQHQRMKLNNG